ncbi:hypothetical protein PFISCL1PPCAC_13234, partial [Pristionchus fissidentatus]
DVKSEGGRSKMVEVLDGRAYSDEVRRHQLPLLVSSHISDNSDRLLRLLSALFELLNNLPVRLGLQLVGHLAAALLLLLGRHGYCTVGGEGEESDGEKNGGSEV